MVAFSIAQTVLLNLAMQWLVQENGTEWIPLDKNLLVIGTEDDFLVEIETFPLQNIEEWHPIVGQAAQFGLHWAKKELLKIKEKILLKCADDSSCRRSLVKFRTKSVCRDAVKWSWWSFQLIKQMLSTGAKTTASKTSLKSGTKVGTRAGAKTAAKAASKAGTKSVAKSSTKAGAKQAGKTLGKATAKQAGKTLGKATAKQAGKTLGKATATRPWARLQRNKQARPWAKLQRSRQARP